ncbi:UDP-galactopyranose mutase [uncultured Thiodictyon sp.]|uniref:UDP-galactopyranose mutase n=1 Tax=uncultured Thiodictyon sp. TaxID=1846217 RepID=UPI0025FF18EC|nr:UDP-galactopyranose mutase [uncultured Thiodictyon sp.]
MMKFVVVGAGFAGSVIAREVAEAGASVLVLDRRGHIAGNAYDEHDEHGVLIHRYGPHCFHTNSERIVLYLQRFTAWRHFELRVRACVDGKLFPIPINRDTINQLYGLDLDEAGIARYLDSVREPRDPIRTSEDVVLASVGRDLYEKFYLGYTRKQWGLEPSELSASVAARIPVHHNRDDRYFQDIYQCVPADGYASMFRNLLDHPNIQVDLGVDFFAVKDRLRYDHLVFTGRIDQYFGECFGSLPYRSLRFESEHLPNCPFHQSTALVNYPDERNFAFTRILESKHITGQTHTGTTITREYPSGTGDPYYPIPRPENEALYRQYKALAERETSVTFVGRLAQYRYYNMDQVIGAALAAADRLLGR